MKYLIVGRSGRGKDTLAKMLEALGLIVIKSYSTRPKRTPDEDTHIFITPEESNKITNKIVTTVINGYEYFTTAEQVNACDVYIIDPNGVYELVKNMPDVSFHIVHCIAQDETLCKKLAIQRSDDPEKEAKIYDKRIADENAQFTAFEKQLKTPNAISDNCTAIHTFNNDYTEETVKQYAQILYAYKKEFDNVATIVDQCVTLQILGSTEPKHVTVTYWNTETTDTRIKELSAKDVPILKEKSVPYEIFVDTLFADDEGFNKILHAWLSHDIHFQCNTSETK